METNKIHNMNCLDAFEKIADESIDLIVTDPPYKIRGRGENKKEGGSKLFANTILRTEHNNKVFKHNDIDITDWINECYRILKTGSHIYIMVNDYNLYHYMTNIIKAGFKITRLLIWQKGNIVFTNYYMTSHEYIIYAHKLRNKPINNKSTSSILHVPNIKTKDSYGNILHPTEKPVELMKILISNSTSKGDVVLDPFIGIGSTSLACMALDRQFIGFEIDKEYYDKAVKRISDYHKQLELFAL